MRSTMSGLMTDRPSCWPLRTRKGRNTSTLFIYTEFSSKEPPRTLYCDDSSECVDTPACVCTISSTALPAAPCICRSSLASSSSVCELCILRPVTSTSPTWLAVSTRVTSRVWVPRGRCSTRVFVR